MGSDVFARHEWLRIVLLRKVVSMLHTVYYEVTTRGCANA
jgi:hypothetical protein